MRQSKEERGRTWAELEGAAVHAERLGATTAVCIRSAKLVPQQEVVLSVVSVRENTVLEHKCRP